MVQEPETPKAGLSRRSVVSAAAWSVPVVAAAIATPLAAASVAAGPTGVGVTTAPNPVESAVPTAFTYFGTTASGRTPFLTGSTAVIVITGDFFLDVSVSGATVLSDSGPGASPRTISLLITDLANFVMNATPRVDFTVRTTVYDSDGNEIGSAVTSFEPPS